MYLTGQLCNSHRKLWGNCRQDRGLATSTLAYRGLATSTLACRSMPAVCLIHLASSLKACRTNTLHLISSLRRFFQHLKLSNSCIMYSTYNIIFDTSHSSSLFLLHIQFLNAPSWFTPFFFVTAECISPCSIVSFFFLPPDSMFF